MGKATEYTRVEVDKLIPYVNNAKQHSDDQITRIASSIREFGFLNPVLIDANYNVIAGHGRILAAKKLQMDNVPCLFVEGLTDAQRKAYILADNRLAEMADWDMDIVMGELEELTELGFDTELTGFEFEVEPEIIDDEDDVPEPPAEPKAKLGDVYQLGRHRLICGDSTDLNVVERLMGGQKADMVFTDPPWNVNYGDNKNPAYKHRSILNDYMPTDEFKEFMNSAFFCMNAASKDGAMTYVVMSAQEWGNLMLTLAENDYHWSSTIIWAKDSLVLSRKDYHTQYEPIWYGWKKGSRLHPLEDRKQSDLWQFARPKRSDEHPTMKPVPLVARAVTNSTNKGDAVLDIFGGSGTTLMACEQTDRDCYMVELDPKYVDVIVERWEAFTGKKAVLING